MYAENDRRTLLNSHYLHRAITIAKGAEAKPHINWAGIFGKGGEDKKYGFEPEVRLEGFKRSVRQC